jgi:hypothetical protein
MKHNNDIIKEIYNYEMRLREELKHKILLTQ